MLGQVDFQNDLRIRPAAIEQRSAIHATKIA